MKLWVWTLVIVFAACNLHAGPVKKHAKHKHTHKHHSHKKTHNVVTKHHLLKTNKTTFEDGYHISLHDDTGNTIAGTNEHAKLMDLLGLPIGNVLEAKSVTGELKTTTVHKLCSGKNSTRTESGDKKVVYDKIICGNFTKKDMYDMHSRNVAKVLDYKGPITKKTLKQQRDELVKAVNLMAQFAGPLPSLTIKKG